MMIPEKLTVADVRRIAAEWNNRPPSPEFVLIPIHPNSAMADLLREDASDERASTST